MLSDSTWAALISCWASSTEVSKPKNLPARKKRKKTDFKKFCSNHKNLILEWLRRRTPSTPKPNKKKNCLRSSLLVLIYLRVKLLRTIEYTKIKKCVCMCVYFYLFFSVNSFFRYVYLHLAKETIKRRETEKSNETKKIG